MDPRFNMLSDPRFKVMHVSRINTDQTPHMGFLCSSCVLGVHRDLKGTLDPHRNGVIASCEPTCGCGESNPSSLEEESWLLSTETSLQPQ